MSDKEIEDLRRQIGDLREALKSKAASSQLSGLAKISEIRTAALTKTTTEEQLATQAWVKKETETSLWTFWKDPEIVGAAFAFTILKFELMSLINLDPAIEKWFNKKGWERNRFGIMAPIPKAEKERRAKEITDAENRIKNIETRLARLTPLLRDARGRIRLLDKRVDKLETRDATTRRAVQNIPSDPSVAGTTNRITRLRAEVDLLTAALA